MRDKAEQARRSNADQTLHVGSVTQVEGDMQRRKAVSPAVSERIPAVAETVKTGLRPRELLNRELVRKRKTATSHIRFVPRTAWCPPPTSTSAMRETTYSP